MRGLRGRVLLLKCLSNRLSHHLSDFIPEQGDQSLHLLRDQLRDSVLQPCFKHQINALQDAPNSCRRSAFPGTGCQGYRGVNSNMQWLLWRDNFGQRRDEARWR